MILLVTRCLLLLYLSECMRLIVIAFRKAIDAARTAKKVGLILGTLGRQGSPSLLLVRVLASHSLLLTRTHTHRCLRF